jgi:NAD-dependent SIR2 family protein deacetylase
MMPHADACAGSCDSHKCEQVEFENAEGCHRRADVALVLGTSLRIRPAGERTLLVRV